MIPEFTTVIGVDAGHLDQFKTSIPTWAQYKPQIFTNPIVIFADSIAVRMEVLNFLASLKHPVKGWFDTAVDICQWPLSEMHYVVEEKDRFSNLQRYRMLSGFVHVAARQVKTPYWLKLDLDVIATGYPDWIDSQWFSGNPAIIGHRWGYTKPAEQIIQLDQWVASYSEKLTDLSSHPPLELSPNPGSSIVRHKRIISWCAFFETEFTQRCSELAETTCGKGMLPVPSQDGYLWYCAARMHREIQRVNMKSVGWTHCSSLKRMKEAIKNAQQGES